MTRRVLVTGGRGFVGRQVVAALRARGAAVAVTLRPGQALPPGAAEAVTTPDLFAEPPGFWAGACRGFDTVVHAAWFAEPGAYLRSARNMDCLAGTLTLARGAAAAGVSRFVGVGTCLEYDVTRRVLATDTPLDPRSPYAAAKAAAALALAQHLPLVGVSFAWCRLFYLHGAGDDPRRLVPYIERQLAAGLPADLSAGHQIRDYMDVADAGAAIAGLALSSHVGAANVCSGVPVTIRQMAERIAARYGRPDLLRFGARPAAACEPDCILGVPTPAPAE